MKIDKFNTPLLRIDTDITEEQFKILCQNIYMFKLAGGVISWDEWVAMDKFTQNAFVAVSLNKKSEEPKVVENKESEADAAAERKLDAWATKMQIGEVSN